jgi:hypothetical protein
MSALVDYSREACEEASRFRQDHDEYAAALILTLRAALDAAERERDGANALVERMHAQDVLAIKQWQEANPGNDLVWPDHMRLTAWCMGEVAKLAAGRDATGYARGVRDAAEAAKAAKLPQHLVESGPMAGWQTFDHEWPKTIRHAILALLPATDATKEKNDGE